MSLPARLLSLPGPFLLALLAGWRLWERGVYIHDEAHALLVAHTLEQGISGLVRGGDLATLKSEILATGGSLYFMAKPGQIALYTLLGLATGGITAIKALGVSFIGGLASVWLTQTLVQRRFGHAPAALAGGIAASTPLLVGASRSALALSLPTALALLAALLLDTRSARHVLCGIAAGIAAFAAFACHYNSAVLTLALLAGLWPALPRSRTAAFLATGFACAILAETATQIAAIPIRHAYPAYATFLGELFHAFGKHQLSVSAPTLDGIRGYSPRAWAYLAQVLGLGMGLTILLLLPAAMWRLRKAPSPAVRFVLCWGLVPLLVWILYPWKVERNFVQTVPGIAAIVALLACTPNPQPARGKTIGTAVLVVLLVAVNVGLCVRTIAGDRSPFAAVTIPNSRLIASLPAGSITARSIARRTLPQWKWYLGPEFRSRTGQYPKCIDFGSTGQPAVLCLDMLTSSSVAWRSPDDRFELLPADTIVRAETGQGWAELARVRISTP